MSRSSALSFVAVTLVTTLLFLSTSLRAEDSITFAMLPQMSNAVIFSKWNPILKHLEKQTGLSIKQVFPKDFAEHEQLCNTGKIDLAYSNPLVYVQISGADNKQGHAAFALANTLNGPKDFYGEFLVRSDNKTIQTFADLRGKKGMVVGWSSAGGGLFQHAYALRQGINMKKDCQVTEAVANKQDKVIMAVYNREVEFGCVRNGMLAELKNRIDLNQIRVLAETPRYPAWVLSVNNRLPPVKAKKLKTACLSIPPALLQAAQLPGAVIGFVPSEPQDLEAVRTLVREVSGR